MLGLQQELLVLLPVFGLSTYSICSLITMLLLWVVGVHYHYIMMMVVVPRYLVHWRTVIVVGRKLLGSVPWVCRIQAHYIVRHDNSRIESFSCGFCLIMVGSWSTSDEVRRLACCMQLLLWMALSSVTLVIVYSAVPIYSTTAHWNLVSLNGVRSRRGSSTTTTVIVIYLTTQGRLWPTRNHASAHF